MSTAPGAIAIGREARRVTHVRTHSDEPTCGIICQRLLAKLPTLVPEHAERLRVGDAETVTQLRGVGPRLGIGLKFHPA